MSESIDTNEPEGLRGYSVVKLNFGSALKVIAFFSAVSSRVFFHREFSTVHLIYRSHARSSAAGPNRLQRQYYSKQQQKSNTFTNDANVWLVGLPRVLEYYSSSKLLEYFSISGCIFPNYSFKNSENAPIHLLFSNLACGLALDRRASI